MVADNSISVLVSILAFYSVRKKERYKGRRGKKSEAHD
jgi:hypothetical protein